MIKAHSLNPGALKACYCLLHVELTRSDDHVRHSIDFSQNAKLRERTARAHQLAALADAWSGSLLQDTATATPMCSAQWWSVDAPARASTSTVHVRANPKSGGMCVGQVNPRRVHAAFRCGHLCLDALQRGVCSRGQESALGSFQILHKLLVESTAHRCSGFHRYILPRHCFWSVGTAYSNVTTDCCSADV
jgi:hypothetical protein